MLNKEKFAKEIVEIACRGESLSVINGKPAACALATCDECDFCTIDNCYKRTQEWANSEYVEPSVDWSKIEVDTPILVKNNDSNTWVCRYFAEYKDGTIYTWADGRTSWTFDGRKSSWKYAKLATRDKNIEKDGD